MIVEAELVKYLIGEDAGGELGLPTEHFAMSKELYLDEDLDLTLYNTAFSVPYRVPSGKIYEIPENFSLNSHDCFYIEGTIAIHGRLVVN